MKDETTRRMVGLDVPCEVGVWYSGQYPPPQSPKRISKLERQHPYGIVGSVPHEKSQSDGVSDMMSCMVIAVPAATSHFPLAKMLQVHSMVSSFSPSRGSAIGTPLPLPSNNSRRTSGPMALCPLTSRRSSKASRWSSVMSFL